MRTIFKQQLVLWATILTVSAGWCQDRPAGSYALSLDGAVQVAFQNNKDLQIQAQEIDIGRAVILGAKSEFLPKLYANASYTHNGNILSFPTAAGAKKDNGIYIGYLNDNIAGLNLQQKIYNGGANLAQFNEAKKNLEVQEQTFRLRKQDIIFETKRLYYGLLLADETQRIAQELVNLAKSHYDDVKKKYDAGTVSKFDLLQSKVQISRLTPELIRAKNAAELIAAELKKLLGLKMDDDVGLTDKLAYSLIRLNEKEFLNVALLNSPELALQSLGMDVNKIRIQLARASGLPQVNAGLGYTIRSNDLGDMFNRRHDNWNAGVSVNVPIFDGFSSKAKVDEAKARYSQSVISKENTVEYLAVEVKSGALDLQKAEALINSQKDSIEEAKESLRIAEVRYDNGEGTNLDIFDAQVSLSQVEKIYSEGIYDYVMATAYLDRILGGNMQMALGQK